MWDCGAKWILHKLKLTHLVDECAVTALQSIEAVCRGVVEQAAAAAEAAQKDCAVWKSKYEAALDRCNQAEFKVHCIGAPHVQQQ